MAFTATPVFPQTPNVSVTNWTSSDGAAATKTIYTGGSNGSKVVAISVATNAAETHLLTLSITRNSTSYVLGAITLPTSSGTDGTNPSISLLTGSTGNTIPTLPFDSDGQKYIFLTSVDTLQITHATSFTSSKKMDVIAFGADF